MTYNELKAKFEENELDIDKAIVELGYATQSPANNWSKAMPEKAEIMFNMYVELQIEKQKLIELKNKLKEKNEIFYLSKDALRIAEQKCKESGIKIKDYLSSLVIAKL